MEAPAEDQVMDLDSQDTASSLSARTDESIQRIIPSGSLSSELPIVDFPKLRRHRICKLSANDDGQQPKESHLRFGPIYSNWPLESSNLKEEAWQHLLKESPGRAAVTIEIYLSAMRMIEKAAREAYDEGVVDNMSAPVFRWMMIKDGCFFLQLALYVLGGAEPLNYPPHHAIFGKRNNEDIKDLIQAMFLVGNQIPLVVLKELMKQIYFGQVIVNGKWEQPSDLRRLALYELLLRPAQEIHCPRPLLWQWLSCRVFPSSRAHWIQEQQPCDLLHGLYLLVLGPKREEEEEEEGGGGEEEEEDNSDEEDLESQRKLICDIRDAVVGDKISFSATKLKKAGVHFGSLCRGKGSRGIHFTNRWWYLGAYPIVYLPPFLVGDDTELMFQNLKNYEASQKVLDKTQHEVSSYLLFMSKLIRTSDDAKFIASKGIIQGKHLKHKQKLPAILRRLAPKKSYNHNLRRVKLETSDYSRPFWVKHWEIALIALIFTSLNTVFSILGYYNYKKKKN